jgi:hypothetical protein
MRIRKSFLGILTLFAACCALGQGTLIYDQQSSTDETPLPLGQGGRLPTSPGLGNGQSFIPTLSSVGFIRLLFQDADPTDFAGATVNVNLRSGSINGPIISTTPTVQMLNTFSGPETFFFPTAVPVTAGSTYYFEPVEQSGGSGGWNAAIGQYNYSGGTAFVSGSPLGPQDYWFREGILVPEPSSAALLLLGGAALISTRRPKRQ